MPILNIVPMMPDYIFVHDIWTKSMKHICFHPLQPMCIVDLNAQKNSVSKIHLECLR